MRRLSEGFGVHSVVEEGSNLGPHWDSPLGNGRMNYALAERMALACARMPRGLICLQSAAQLHGLREGTPGHIWLALPQGSQPARMCDEEWRVIRWTNSLAFEIGVQSGLMGDLLIRTTSAPRTIVDLVRCSRYQSGHHAALHAGICFKAIGGQSSDIFEIAERLGVSSKVMRSLEEVVRHSGMAT